MVAGFLFRIGNLALRPRFEVAQEGVAHRARVKARWRKAVEQHIAFVERAQPVLPVLRNRAFPRQQRARAILKGDLRSEEHTSELQSLMRISYAVFCLKKKII